jgi:hypothetical protein
MDYDTDTDLDPAQPADPCVCGAEAYRITWHRHRDGRRHIRCCCARCGQWLAWLPQTPVNCALADLGGPYAPDRADDAGQRELGL